LAPVAVIGRNAACIVVGHHDHNPRTGDDEKEFDCLPETMASKNNSGLIPHS
jgi:hypothetical protein